MMEICYEHRFTIRSRSVDAHRRARPSELLSALQAAGDGASEPLDLSRDVLLQRYHAVWMLARVWFRLFRPLGDGEELLLRTWHRGNRAATVYRDFDLFVKGARVGEAVSSWVLADQETRALLRPRAFPELGESGGGSLCKEKELKKLRPPRELALLQERELYESDTDVNGHVNNARYADFVTDALGLDRLPPEHFVAEMQLSYLAECVPGERLSLFAAREGARAYLRGSGPDGRARFDAELITAARS